MSINAIDSVGSSPRQAVLALLLIALGALPSRSEDAPRIRETNPVTGESEIRSMIPLEKLPVAEAARIARLSDSVFAALGGEIRTADGIRMVPDLPSGIVRGKALKGAVLQGGGKVAIAVETSASDRDLTGDVAWALWYARTFGDAKIQFSLDPVDVNDFSKGNVARYSPPDALKPFSIGRDLYEADMDLKLYALGYERAGGTKVRDIASPPVGYRSRVQIAADLFAKGIERQGALKARLWIVCDSVFATSTDSAMRIDSVRVKIHARQVASAAGNQMEDIADADTVTALFAHWFETNYFQLAAEHPELAAVVENAKALSIARWILSRGAVVPEMWSDLLLPLTDSTVVGGPALVRRDTLRRNRAGGKDILTIELTGGVELGASLAETRLPSPKSVLGGNSGSSGSARYAHLEASLCEGGNVLRPLKDDWLKTARAKKVDGREWTIAANGLPSASVDASGGKTSFASAGRRVVAASAIAADRHATLQRMEEGYMLNYQDQDHIVSARYDAKGHRTALWDYPAHREVPGH